MNGLFHCEARLCVTHARVSPAEPRRQMRLPASLHTLHANESLSQAEGRDWDHANVAPGVCFPAHF